MTGTGMDELKKSLEGAITSSTGRVRKTFRIPVGGDHLRFTWDIIKPNSLMQCNSDELAEKVLNVADPFFFIDGKWIFWSFFFYSWLYRNATVLSTTDGEDGHSYLVETIISTSAYGKFKHLFSKRKKKSWSRIDFK